MEKRKFLNLFYERSEKYQGPTSLSICLGALALAGVAYLGLSSPSHSDKAKEQEFPTKVFTNLMVNGRKLDVVEREEPAIIKKLYFRQGTNLDLTSRTVIDDSGEAFTIDSNRQTHSSSPAYSSRE